MLLNFKNLDITPTKPSPQKLGSTIVFSAALACFWFGIMIFAGTDKPTALATAITLVFSGILNTCNVPIYGKSASNTLVHFLLLAFINFLLIGLVKFA